MNRLLLQLKVLAVALMVQMPCSGQYLFRQPSAGSDTKSSIVTEAENWIPNAVIYEITPYLFVQNAKYPDITAKLPELVKLGVNTIWLQPVFRNYGGGQGYDITDYFSLREDLGTEAELGELVQTAKSLGLKIIFDFVANHTSVYHPYAIDCKQNGISSSYFNYYQHENDKAPYSSYYHVDANGFYYYFWNDLVNLNYNNENVRKWIIDACKHWIEKFDIDGYRFDAAWGFISRSPEFADMLVAELKYLKPGLLLLAEDKGSVSSPYDHGFQAAYDWAKDTAWVSQWSWEYGYSGDQSLTVFNHPSVNQRALLLRQALFEGFQSGLRLRYLENNDMHRFIANHNQSVTEMAAALMFSLPGIPLIYNGQETGARTFPYESGPLFQRNKSIESLNSSLFRFYSKLTGIRKEHPSLSSDYIKEIPVSGSPGAVAFHRKDDNEDIIVVVNMNTSLSDIELQLVNIISFTGNKLSLHDLMLDQDVSVNAAGAGKIKIPVGGSTTRLLKLNRKPPGENEGIDITLNPNPGTGRFVLNFSAQEPGVLKLGLYDRLGRKLASGNKTTVTGSNRVEVDFPGLAAGMYFLHLEGSGIKKAMPLMISTGKK